METPDSKIARLTAWWQLLKGPASFLVGVIIIGTELVNYMRGGAVDTSLLFVAAGFIGLPIFAPASK